MFFYYLYDRKFISDIHLFNIPMSDTVFSDPEVIIHKGSFTVEQLENSKMEIQISQKCSLVNFRFGAIKILDGKEIIYTSKENYTVEHIMPFIAGWGIAMVLTQMGFSAFHCSALTYNNNCFFVSGVSGAGKSTTSLELLKHGCKYLSDDIAIVNSYNDMLVAPAFPVQKLCPDVTFDINEDCLYEINNSRGKYSYLNIIDYCATPKRLTTIFKLMAADVPQISVEEITGLDKYLRVMECLFLEVPYALTSFPDDEKFRCLKIAGNVRFYNITRPKYGNTLQEISNTILKILDEQDK